MHDLISSQVAKMLHGKFVADNTISSLSILDRVGVSISIRFSV